MNMTSCLMKHFENLKAIIGEDGVYCDDAHLSVYGFDSTRLVRKPSYVVFPKNEAQVVKLVEYANEHKLPITPRGAGSGMSGGSINEGIILAMQKHFSSILEIDLENLCVRVQPGVINARLNQELKSYGLFFPPDPASQAFSTVGGNIAENAGGMNALRYGVSKNHILSMRVVLGSGEMMQIGHRTYKDVAGYDLLGLMCGSEGTLGIMTELTLKLSPIPRYSTSILLCFKNAKELARAACMILAEGVLPYAMEFLDTLTIMALNQKYEIYPKNAGAVLIIKLSAQYPEVLERDRDEIKKISKKFSLISFWESQNKEDEERIWFGRKNASQANSIYGRKKLNEDITVPRNKVAEFLEKVEEIGKKYQLTIPCFGHIGDGNIHTNVMLQSEDELQIGYQAVKELFEIALLLGGTLSGEHGIGIAKSSFMPMAFESYHLELFKKIKSIFDPNCILNPHKMGF
ncbi:FAD-binding oxidoreductase [Helicobacter kayseriensis]|nr:FAD-linked oxidase C-terminal domain-containing protein [Helicobacter kayseriensis]